MGIMDSFKSFINGDEDDEELDENEDFDEVYEQEFEEKNQQQTNTKAQAGSTRSSSAGLGFSSANPLELKVVKPEKYDSQTAEKIASHLLNKRSVVLNLESTNKESARRLIDFLTGVAYSIGGYIQRVATNTFIIVPQNVDVSGEQLQEAKRNDEDLF
ncbi:MAG: cell division protein SepF [Firmicutes bacterium]|nr:cell division protein SepF [Candidatus Colimorpha enterica]